MTCREVPARPYSPPIPPRYITDPDYAWNSGANSVSEVDGDLHVTFDMRGVIGVVIGLLPANERGMWDSYQTERIRHGLYFHRSQGGAARFAVYERGRQVSAAEPYLAGDAFTIRRVGATVEYLHGTRRVMTSLQPSAGTQIVGCCLYASEDVAPG